MGERIDILIVHSLSLDKIKYSLASTERLCTVHTVYCTVFTLPWNIPSLQRNEFEYFFSLLEETAGTLTVHKM